MITFWQRCEKLIVITLLGFSLSLGINLTSKAQIAPSQLVEQAQAYYQTGKLAQSLKLLEKANQVYQSQSKYLQQAQVIAWTSLVQQRQGNWSLAQKNIATSLALTEAVPASKNKTQVLAQIWNTQGHFQFLTGQNNQALDNWQQAQELYAQIGDRLGVAGSLLDQAQALEQMGFHRRGCNYVLQAFDHPDYNCANLTSSQIITIVQQAQDSPAWQLKGLTSIGNSLLSMGKLSQAKTVVEASQSINSKLPQPSGETKAQILLSLGNINKAIALQAREREDSSRFANHVAKAIKYYQQLERYSSSWLNTYRLPAQLNHLSLLSIIEQKRQAQQLVNKIKLNTDNYDNNQNLYAQVKFARILESLKYQNIYLKQSWQDIAQIYLNVIESAQAINDSRIQSYALGYLGKLQQKQQNLALDNTPQELIEQALILAQSEQALEIAYRWQWQLGRIYRQQGKRTQAIASYQAALASLNNLRSDLVSLTKEIQFNFREQIEPVYREFADLLLDVESPDYSELEQARNVIEALQVAELDDYFQDACLTFEPKSIDKIDPNAAIIYTIILPNRLEVIMAMNNVNSSLGGQVFRHHTQIIAQAELEDTVEQLRAYITEPDRLNQVQQLSAQVYSWLIEPFIADLNTTQPKTLVFVLDNILQTIPMSGLYDGQQYLLENYAIAITPGLRLLSPQINFQQPVSLAGGISQPVQVANQQFSALDNVNNELNIFSQSQNKVLLNDQFIAANLVKQLNSISPSRIHFATHAQFSSNPDQTFLLLWQQLLKISDLSNLLLTRKKAISNPIDLLVLSACDTASGDRRAALGLAGIAVRSGSMSTLATLWQVKDDSTAILMENFYQQLEHNTKAEALRQAQLKLWETTDKDWKVPAFWSAYILIGNWQ